MKSNRFSPYPAPATQYGSNGSSANALTQLTENNVYNNNNTSNVYYCYFSDPNSIVPMPYASPGKFNVNFSQVNVLITETSTYCR